MNEIKLQYRKHTRLKDYNYSANSAYFITICTDCQRKSIGEKERPIIEREIKTLEVRFAGLKVDFYILMEDHLHIIFILNDANVSLPKVIQAFKSKTSLGLKRNGYKGKVFWQKNYYDHIVRSEEALGKIREYIQNNPLAEGLKLEEIYENEP